MTDFPPSYDELAHRPSCPAYTHIACASERVLQSAACAAQQLEQEEERKCTWIYESDHMVVNLGSQSWGLHAPTYGLSGTVQGSVTFKGGQTYVEQVTATLEGKIKVVHAVRGQATHPIFSRTITLYASYMGAATWHRTQSFSIPFPAEVFAQTGTAKLPPSFAAYDHPVLHCEISYVLRLDMVRKGMRRHESRTIPILYLPKSSPSNPPLADIPMPFSGLSRIPFCLEERVKTEALSPQACLLSKDTNFAKCIYLSLPSPLSFTAGESIPFILSFVFPNAPALTGLLAPHFRLVLLQRVRVLWKGVPITMRERKISAGDVQLVSHPAEGVAVLSGVIPAGMGGRECAWGMDGVVEIQYLVRAFVCPPSIVAGSVPSFFHEESVDISTDPWGTRERELAATGGVPAPALGLACNIEKRPLASQF